MDAPIPHACDVFGSLLDVLNSEAVASELEFVSSEYGTYNDEKLKTCMKTTVNLYPS